MTIHFLCRRLVVQGAHGRVRVEGITYAHRLGGVYQSLDDLIVGSALNKDTFSCAAHLTGIKKATNRGYLASHRQISIVKNDGRSISSQFQQQRLAGRPLRDVLAGLRAAGEPDRIRPWVGYNLIADNGPWAGHQVDDTGRHVGFFNTFHKLDGTNGGGRCWYPNHGVARSQRRSQVVGWDAYWKVPGRNYRVHTPWLAEAEDTFVGVFDRNDRRFQPLDVLSRVIKSIAGCLGLL